MFTDDFRIYEGSFRKLIVWQEAHKLAVLIYKETMIFPDHEKFGIRAQIRDAASSIGANIAEGSARSTYKDQNKFYVNAKGSLRETDNFLELAHDLGYISDSAYEKILLQLNKVGYLLIRLINRSK
ncbi:MAG TPA: four helix bundle protein [Candidatus Peribacteraceae bacterium]|nr:four helix bundle protein [Candidatus Peribacteraceae bacterium]